MTMQSVLSMLPFLLLAAAMFRYPRQLIFRGDSS